jgi:glucosamine-6-phosphate deaminase
MQIEILADETALSRRAADLVAETLAHKPDATLTFPTGNTPLALFRELVRRAKNNDIDFRQVRIIELDDYFGIAQDDPRNLYNWLERELLLPAGIKAAQVTRFQTDVTDVDAEIRRMESTVALQGIDLLFLGLGPNGHLGFNEPGTRFDTTIQVIDLTPESIASNANYWGGEDRVPRQGITLGLKSLMQAKQVVLLVSGERKADILAQLMSLDATQITTELPASILYRHPNARVLADEAAASKLGSNPQ